MLGAPWAHPQGQGETQAWVPATAPPPIHPGSLYFPAGLLTLHHSGCIRNSKYPLSGHHFSTRHPGLLTLGILPGMQNWALCYFFLLFLLLSLLCHPSCCLLLLLCLTDPQRDYVLGQTVTTHEEYHSQAESYTRPPWWSPVTL